MSPKTTSRQRWSIAFSLFALCSIDSACTTAFAQTYIAPPVIKRQERDKPEPPLVVEWHKRPATKSLELFDGSLDVYPKLSDDPFETPPNAVPLSDRRLFKNDPFSLGTLEWHYKPIVFLATTQTKKGGYKYTPLPEPSLYGDAFGDSPLNKYPWQTIDDESDDSAIQSQPPGVNKTVLTGYTSRDAISHAPIPPIRKTLHDIWLIESKFEPAGKSPTASQKSRLKRLYTRAAQLEPHAVLKTYYRFMANLSSEDLDGAWREVATASRQAPGNTELLESFADEFKNLGLFYDWLFFQIPDACAVPNLSDVHREYVAGREAFDKSRWNTARLHFNRLHKLIPKNVEFTRSIANEYSNLDSTAADAIVWQTRLMNIAPDKQTFEAAKCARQSAIERTKPAPPTVQTPAPKYDDTFTSAHWNPARFPLKVYFAYKPLANAVMSRADAAMRAASLQALNDWMIAAQGKIDFVEVGDRASADIVCERIKRLELLKKPPATPPAREDWVPGESIAGATFPRQNAAGEITFATIRFYKDASDKIDIQTVTAHELGHALGMLKHSKSENDIMYESVHGPTRHKPSVADTAYIRSIYADYGVSLTGESKFLGLQANCELMNTTEYGLPTPLPHEERKHD